MQIKDAFMCVTVTVSTQSSSRMKPVTAEVLGGTVLTFTACITTPNTFHERMRVTTSLTTGSPEDFILSIPWANAAVTTDRCVLPCSILDLKDSVHKVLLGTLVSNSPITKRVQETNQ